MNHNKAQTITEYLALVTMLGLALAIGWDFIAGGFQGGVKNLSQSVDIASNDPLRRGGGAPQLPFCNCDDDLNNWNCGEEPTIPIPATINCNPRQRYKRKLCTGSLCSQAQIEWCEWDNTCCIWLGRDPPSATLVDHCWDDYCPQPTVGAQGWGNGRWLRQCGNDPSFHECRGETICQFSCGWDTVTSSAVGPTPPQGSIPCPNDDFQVPDNAVPWSFVTNGLQSNCSNPQRSIMCERYCPTGTGWNPGTGRCETAVCGDAIKHPTLEACDHGGTNEQPLVRSRCCRCSNGAHVWCCGNPPNPPQQQICIDNCQSVGYRYWMRSCGNVTEPPGHQSVYTQTRNGDWGLNITCQAGKIFRLAPISPIDTVNRGLNQSCEGSWGNNRNICFNADLTVGGWPPIPSAEGAHFCRIGCMGFAGSNHSWYSFVCANPNPLQCFAMSRWETRSYATCPSYAYQFMAYREGGAGARAGIDHKVTICCLNSTKSYLNLDPADSSRHWSCIPRSVVGTTSPCGLGQTSLYSFTTQNQAGQQPTTTNICCSTSLSSPPPLPQCSVKVRQLPLNATPLSPGLFRDPLSPNSPELSPDTGWSQFLRYCEGQCYNQAGNTNLSYVMVQCRGW